MDGTELSCNKLVDNTVLSTEFLVDGVVLSTNATIKVMQSKQKFADCAGRGGMDFSWRCRHDTS